jgi:hypothetical protein
VHSILFDIHINSYYIYLVYAFCVLGIDLLLVLVWTAKYTTLILLKGTCGHMKLYDLHLYIYFCRCMMTGNRIPKYCNNL